MYLGQLGRAVEYMYISYIVYIMPPIRLIVLAVETVLHTLKAPVDNADPNITSVSSTFIK